MEGDRHPSTPFLDNLDAFFLFVIMMISFAIRYWRIALPATVIFDEIYFGNFTNYYTLSEFYYDIHPPLAKITMFLFAKLSEYDGSVNFLHRPQGYTLPDYVHLRVTPASLSALCFPLLYISMRFMRFSRMASLTGTFSSLFDTSMATEGRFILSDGVLHFFACLHIAILSFTLTLRWRSRHFTLWHILTGVSLCAACSCKNTAWGLMAFDGFAYCMHFFGLRQLSWLDYAMDLVIYGGTLAAICAAVYFGSFSLHLVLLPYRGPGYGYLQENMKRQLVPIGDSLFGRRLSGPGLLLRGLILTLRMHQGNMGIQQFHDSQSFPRHWPVLGSVSVFFWASGRCQIRCWGNAFSYYQALVGVIVCALALRRSNGQNALKIVVGYAVSYFPFYLIPRVMYLYHYLIPLMFGGMAFGAAIDLYIAKKAKGVICILGIFCVVFGWWLWSPYVYGTEPHDQAMMEWSKKWVDGDLDHQSRRASRNRSSAGK
jgi:dolichyl-phosphate-mannose--protein O-mannosyl transferase